ncbi:MAG: hypothetical protein O3B95_04045 [Chloroflexi bacterium]|nr:hypothetical protein [Chloroflexota bacterium]
MGKPRGNASGRSGGIYSGGIKPLNVPRVVHVRTDPAGNPVSIQVPPTITSPRGRRAANQRSDRDSHSRPEDTRLPPRKRVLAQPAPTANAPLALVSDGKWVKVTEIENLWKVSDEWWRGPEEEIARLYYTLRLENSQQITVYLDLIANSWHRQAG